MTLTDLIKMLEKAKEQKLDISIEVTVEGQENTEIIMNRNASIDNKIIYYKETYNEDLTDKNNENVRIVGISMGEYF